MDSVITYILAFAAITMVVVFGFRSWTLAQRERRSRQLRRSGSRQRSRGFSRHSSRHSRRHSSSRHFYRGDRGFSGRGDRSSRGDFRRGSDSSSPPDGPSSPKV